ncbi:MAG: BBP7 family outer membrane beta-barrel protein, partial [Chlamydiia bacterium]|nr:BBP7 family outer membrane beta-barrel protein [Chlamydiia bacterium]
QTEQTLLIALEDTQQGEASAKRENRVWGAHAALNYDLGCNRGVNFICLLGYQHFCVDDFVELNASSSGLIQEESISIKNRFSCDNLFDGGLIGLGGRWGCGPYGASIIGKFSFGAMRSKVSIEGFGDTGEAVDFVGFVQDSNRGTCQKDFFTTVLELDAKFSYQICKNLEVSVGYAILYWPRVYLAGKQIDRNLNELDDSIYPRRFNRKSSFWMQGITVGLSGYF